MKITFSLNISRGAIALLALLPAVSSASENTTSAPSQSGEETTHVLFTGTDIRVLHGGSLYRVRGVDGGSFVIKVKDKDVEIPMGKNPEALKLARIQTLTERSATLAKFKYERTYTPANDPVRKWTSAMVATSEMNAAADITASALNATPQTMQVYVPKAGVPMGELKTVNNPQYEVARGNALSAGQRVSGNMGSNTTYAEKILEEQARKLFDAVEVEFEVSSAKPVASPYVVIMARYHERDDPKHSQNWLFAKALAAIDSTPRKETVMEGGFPLGFEVESLQVHLYEKGQEIATDLSENRAPLTRDEAHEYLVIEHVSTHKTDTLPPKVALTKLPEDWATHPKGESFRKTYYVKVDGTGHAMESFEDEACTIKVADAYCEGVLRNLLFLPALKKGNATDSIARVNLDELSL